MDAQISMEQCIDTLIISVSVLTIIIILMLCAFISVNLFSVQNAYSQPIQCAECIQSTYSVCRMHTI